MLKSNIHEKILDSATMPFENCHASYLAVLPNGEVLVVFFAGTREGADDVTIWGARRVNGAWSAPFEIVNDGDVPHWNPVLMIHERELLLYYKVGKPIQDWMTRIVRSQDNGVTWSASAELVTGDRGGRGPVRNKIIVLSNGTWLAPASTEAGIWASFVDRSEDQGKSWVRSCDIRIPELEQVRPNFKQKRGIIQPTLWESAPGQVHMLLRSSEGHIYRSDSTDGGYTWCDAYETELPNNNSGIDVVRLPNGALVLCYNPVGLNWGARTPICVTVSRDNGQTWGEELVLENADGEFSYPAIIAEGNEIYLTYTWKRTNIAFHQLTYTEKEKEKE